MKRTRIRGAHEANIRRAAQARALGGVRRFVSVMGLFLGLPKVTISSQGRGQPWKVTRAP